MVHMQLEFAKDTPRTLANFEVADLAELTVKNLRDRYPYRVFMVQNSSVKVLSTEYSYDDHELEKIQEFAAGCYYILTGRNGRAIQFD